MLRNRHPENQRGSAVWSPLNSSEHAAPQTIHMLLLQGTQGTLQKKCLEFLMGI